MDLERLNRVEPDKCKGLFFRCRINAFEGNNGNYYKSLSLILLKRRSCSGCTDCDMIREYMTEGDEMHELSVDRMKHGAVYQILVQAYFNSYEGYCDDAEIEINEVKEQG